MATVSVTDADVRPQDPGTGRPAGEFDDPTDAAGEGLLARYNGNGSGYVLGLNFSNPDATNGTIDVGPGTCFVVDDSTSTTGNRSSGGNPQVQRTASSGYDTELQSNTVYAVSIPSTYTLDVGSRADVWVNITDVGGQNSVELRSSAGGGTTAEPSDTYTLVGNVVPGNTALNTRPNDGPEVDRESADLVVSSAITLDNLDSNLSRGDTVFIEQKETPHRTREWIDVNTQEVTITGESRFAGNGEPLIMPVNGADVGGFRVGTGATSIDYVTLKNLGFHGNDSTMTDTVKRLHAYILENTDYATVRNCYATRTHPYHEHDTGGSAVDVRGSSTNYEVIDCRVHDIGDRGVQIGAVNGFVRGCWFTAGYDRCVSLDTYQPDGEWYLGSFCTIQNNFFGDTIQGSSVSVSANRNATLNGTPTDVLVQGNVHKGDFRGAVRPRGGPARWHVLGNYAYHEPGNYSSPALACGPDGVVAGNVVIETRGSGSNPFDSIIQVDGSGALVSGNYGDLNHAVDYGVRTTSNQTWIVGNGINRFLLQAIRNDGGSEVACISNVYWTDYLSPDAFIESANGAGNMYLIGNAAPMAGSGTAPVDNYSLTQAPVIAEGNYPKYYFVDSINNLSGGITFSFAVTGASPGDDLKARVVPNQDPGNDVGFSVDKYWYDTSSGEMKVQVSETENAGGGQARIMVERVQPF